MPVNKTGTGHAPDERLRLSVRCCRSRCASRASMLCSCCADDTDRYCVNSSLRHRVGSCHLWEGSVLPKLGL